jgi:hypothetical protein
MVQELPAHGWQLGTEMSPPGDFLIFLDEIPMPFRPELKPGPGDREADAELVEGMRKEVAFVVYSWIGELVYHVYTVFSVLL